jgi:hypothetical protein
VEDGKSLATQDLTPETLGSLTPIQLMDLANENHNKILGRERTNLKQAIVIGMLLTLAKDKLRELGQGHGTWQEWIQENFAGGYDTSNVYRNLYNHREAITGCVNIAEAREHIKVLRAQQKASATNAAEAEATTEAVDEEEQELNDDIAQMVIYEGDNRVKRARKNWAEKNNRRFKDLKPYMQVYLAEHPDAEMEYTLLWDEWIARTEPKARKWAPALLPPKESKSE